MKKRIISVLLILCMLIYVWSIALQNNNRISNDLIDKIVYKPVLAVYTAYIIMREETQESTDSIGLEIQKKMEKIETIEDRKEWFIAYKSIINEYEHILDSPETIYDYFNEEEIYLMQRCIETETYQCDFESKVNVANVILNRLESDKFSDEVSEIIVEKQFAFWRSNISEDTILALEYAFQIEDTTTGALYFEKGNVHESYAQPLFTDSAMHRFYQ